MNGAPGRRGTLARYDDIADWYNRVMRSGSPMHDLTLPSLFELIGPVGGKRICDLGCGQGVVARELARRGAIVVGVDISSKMLEFARRAEEADPAGIRYICDDARALARFDDASFDGIVCNFALMDIQYLAPTLRAVRRTIRPDGWFVFSITHPCFQTPVSRWIITEEGATAREVGEYFVEGYWRSDNVHGVRGKVGAHHRTLSTYLNSLSEAGLMVDRLSEPRAEGEVADRRPECHEMPAVLVVRCKSVPAQAILG